MFFCEEISKLLCGIPLVWSYDCGYSLKLPCCVTPDGYPGHNFHGKKREKQQQQETKLLKTYHSVAKISIISQSTC